MASSPSSPPPAPPEPALELRGVTKVFGATRAVDDLTLTLPAGAFLGLLGRNGAGKSTTLKLATGLMKPTAGTIRVLGLPMPGEALRIKRLIGVVPEDLGLLERLTGAQFMRFVGRMHGLEDALVGERTRELFDVLELQPDPGALLCDYSYGMKKKVALAAALVHGPRLLFLDEPFEGIDPVAARTIRAILARLQERGVALILTSHVLEIVEKLCPAVAIIDRGRLLAHGTLSELRRHAGDDLESLFVALVGGGRSGELSWL